MPGTEPGTFAELGGSITTKTRGTQKLIGRNFIIKTFEPY